MELVPLDAIAADATFRLRETGDVSELASAIGRLGQLEPVELRPLPGDPGGRFQVVAGFRRVEAVRLLQRDRVAARVHPGLSDGDAWALALAGVLFAEPVDAAALGEAGVRVRERLPWALPLLERRGRSATPAAAPAPAADPSPSPPARLPEDPAAFAHALAARAYALNGDLAAAFERWSAIPPEGRRLVLEQLRFVARILPLLEKENR